LQGYREALAAGIEFDPELVVSDESESWGGFRAAPRFIGLLDDDETDPGSGLTMPCPLVRRSSIAHL
jgi:hypothetical protein